MVEYECSSCHQFLPLEKFGTTTRGLPYKRCIGCRKPKSELLADLQDRMQLCVELRLDNTKLKVMYKDLARMYTEVLKANTSLREQIPYPTESDDDSDDGSCDPDCRGCVINRQRDEIAKLKEDLADRNSEVVLLELPKVMSKSAKRNARKQLKKQDLIRRQLLQAPPPAYAADPVVDE